MSHSELLNADNLYECPECTKAFPKYVSLYKHRRIHTGIKNRKYECLICGHRFVQKVQLTVHNRRHTGEKPFHCQYCDKAFARKDHLKNHERIHAESPPDLQLACETCGKQYHSKSALQIHIQTNHSPSGTRKRFKCDLCELSYSRPQSLKQHVSTTHFGEKPIKCSVEGCSDEFKNRYQEKQHLVKVHKMGKLNDRYKKN